MISVGIIGAGGYTGQELIRILDNHSKVLLKVINSNTLNGKKISSIIKNIKKFNNLIFTNYSIDEINSMDLDIIFLCTPHGKSMSIVPKLKCKIIDLSSDYRFSSKVLYEKIYSKHTDFRKVVYGLPEMFRESIKNARIIANPGCYATASILSILPLMNLIEHVIFDAKSGYSGAGRDSIFVKDSSILRDNIYPYKLVGHRHKYEIEQFVKCKVSFTPHVINTFRGILCTSHILLKKNAKVGDIIEKYKKFYKGQVFTQVTEKIPTLHDVQGTNKCLLGGFEIDENNQLIIISVIDNLVKGASGQAVQNMNLMLGFNENEGL